MTEPQENPFYIEDNGTKANLGFAVRSPSFRLHPCQGFFIEFCEQDGHKPPCRIHRWFQRLVFGFRYEILNK